jgi:hypothetical protein
MARSSCPICTALKGQPITRLPLAAIAIVHLVTGVMTFAQSHNPHHLGPALMGLLIGAALVVPTSLTRSDNRA